MNNAQAMVRLLLVRHGESTDNAAGLVQGQGGGGLSELGRGQALAVADRVRAERFTVILASDLLRARETAEIVAAVLGGAPVVTDSRLREQGFGVHEGRPVRQLLRAMVKSGADFTTFDPPDGEVSGLFRARVADFLAELAGLRAGETVLLVTHHGFIRMTQRLCLAARLPQCAAGGLGNGSITLVEIDRVGVRSFRDYPAEPEEETRL